MEEQLRSRKMASASIRRHRFSERQKHKELMAEQREDWRKRRQRYSELYKTDSDHSRSNSPDHDSSGESPSEHSVPTPGGSISPDVEFNISVSDLTLERFTRKTPATDTMAEAKTAGIQDWNLKTTLPKMTKSHDASTHPKAMHSHRFSVIIDSIDIAPDDTIITSDSETHSGTDSEEDTDGDYEYSPIEIATPVAFCVPSTRPSVIRVVEPRSQRSWTKSGESMSNTPSPRNSISTYNSQQTSRSRSIESRADLSHEAEPYEVFESTSSSIISITPSADDSSSTSDQGRSNDDIRRKSSMPMLSKLTHARMNSLKKLIKPQSIPGALPAVPQIASNHYSQVAENVRSLPASPSAPSPIYLNKVSGEYETFDRSPWRSTTEPLTQSKRTSTVNRPQTSHPSRNATGLFYKHETAHVSIIPMPEKDQEAAPLIKRKKSFSNLRRRSGSLVSKSPVLDNNPPPVPIINTDDYGVFRYGPPPKASKSTKASGLLLRSPFPSGGHPNTSIGLGLRV